jgi:hypothetical protein
MGKPLTHAQRQALIRTPIVVRTHGGKSYGGCGIRQEPLPEHGRRVYTPSPEDEATFIRISQE